MMLLHFLLVSMCGKYFFKVEVYKILSKIKACSTYDVCNINTIFLKLASYEISEVLIRGIHA